MMKSFRGRIADGGQERIRLSTNDGLTGYKINKFQVMSHQPFFGDISEHCLKIYAFEQDTVDGVVDFTSPILLGVAISTNHTSGWLGPPTPVIIFDNKKFNQDIFVTCNDAQGTEDCNYYIELEQVKLSLDESTVATLKDMRGRE